MAHNECKQCGDNNTINGDECGTCYNIKRNAMTANPIQINGEYYEWENQDERR